MQKDILKILEANMPKQAGELLQERLRRADEMEVEISDLESYIEDYKYQVKVRDGDIAELEKKVSELEETIRDDAELIIKTKEEAERLDGYAKSLSQREDSLQMTIISNELELLRNHKDDMYNLVDKVFKNRTTRESIIMNITQSGSTHSEYDASNNYVGEKFQPNGMTTESDDKTTTEE